MTTRTKFLAHSGHARITSQQRLSILTSVLILLGCLTSQILASVTSASKNEPHGRKSVTTPFGAIRGETIATPAADGDDLPAVTQYLGIPYGVQPSAQYRFNMAISAAKWTHQPKDAFKLPAVCIQQFPQLSETEALKSTSSQRFDHIHKILPHLKPQSEDCLFMNIYVPEKITRRETGPDAPKLSVLVIVHGGDFQWGGANAFNGSILAGYGQIMVVVLNYRLGIYGFLGRCESSSCTGNAGLSDLVAALNLLNNILPSFDADPSSVTLLGWGSGASLVSLLMASPITQPKNRLFRRAILLDGSALSPWGMVTNPQQYFMQLADELGCGDGEKQKMEQSSDRVAINVHKQISQIVRCMQDHSQQNLTAAASKLHIPSFLSLFGPIVDGQIVPNHPKVSFSPKFGALFRDIDLMLGTVSYPAHHLLSNADIENGIEPERRDKILRTLTRNLFDFHRTEIFAAVLNEYTDWENGNKNHPKTIRNNILAALGDVLFTAPLVETARMHSTDEVPKSSNTFLFAFAHETRAWAREYPHGIRGSLSDDHVPYILGYPLSSSAHDRHQHRDGQIYTGFSNDDKAISRVLMKYISNFVKFGDPKPLTISTETAIEERFHGTPWPQFSPETRDAYLEITDRPRVKNYYRNPYVGFWNSFIPQLNRGKREDGVPEEHHFLPDHFNKHSFFGVVRPYSSFRNDPFPPPPLPPTPFPRDVIIKKPSSTSTPALSTSSTKDKTDADTKTAAVAENYSLVITVAVGVGLLVLNLCVYMIMFKRCCERKRKSKKHLKYSYTTGHPSNADITYVSNSPLGQQLPPPPPPLVSSNLNTDASLKFGDDSPPSNNYTFNGGINTLRSSSLTHHHATDRHQTPSAFLSKNNEDAMNSGANSYLHEQEPLLAGTNSKIAGLGGRTGISPTCPRHGRTAQLLMAANRADSIGSSQPTIAYATQPQSAVEEVQV